MVTLMVKPARGNINGKILWGKIWLVLPLISLMLLYCTQPTLPLHQVSFDMMKTYLLRFLEMVKRDLSKHVLTHQWALRGLFYFTEILFEMAAAQIYLPVYWIPRYILKHLASKRLPAICCSSTVPTVPLFGLP